MYLKLTSMNCIISPEKMSRSLLILIGTVIRVSVSDRQAFMWGPILRKYPCHRFLAVSLLASLSLLIVSYVKKNEIKCVLKNKTVIYIYPSPLIAHSIMLRAANSVAW